MERTYFIVDDDALQNEIHSLILGKIDPEARVLSFTTSAEAFAAMDNDLSPEIIFLDLHIPGEDATSFLDGHKARNSPGDIYLMSSLAYLDEPELQENYPAIKDFISKPLLDYKLKNVLRLYA